MRDNGSHMDSNGAYYAEHIVVMLPDRRAMLAAIRERGYITTLVQRAPWTMACIRFTDADGIGYVGYGFAKQNRYGRYADEWNGNTGREIAEGRALGDLLNHLCAERADRVFGPAFAMEA